MKYKQFQCVTCNHNFEKMVAEFAINAACPACGRLSELVKFGMNLGLTFNQAFGAVIAGFVIYIIYQASDG